MMNSGDISVIVVTAIITGAVLILLMTRRFFAFREKKIEAETTLAAEKAAQYAASNKELELRVRVLEQIVTDSGAQTAAQIEALRATPPLKAARHEHTSETE
jgi:hypothetical protein